VRQALESEGLGRVLVVDGVVATHRARRGRLVVLARESGWAGSSCTVYQNAVEIRRHIGRVRPWRHPQ